jgi:hypothetical protein
LVFFTSLLTLLYGASRKPNSLTLAKIASCVTTPIFTLSGLVTGSNFAITVRLWTSRIEKVALSFVIPPDQQQ